MLDFERNIYTESQYSFATLTSGRTFINFDMEKNEPIGLDLNKFDNPSTEQSELLEIKDVMRILNKDKS